MSTRVHIGISDNRKTGKMWVSTSGDDTCPPACEHLKQGTCYAKFSFLGIHWRKVSSGQRDMGWDKLLKVVQDMPPDTLWRHNQAGDLPGAGNKIDPHQFHQLIEANRNKRGFTYTHKPLTPKNLDLIHYANANDFTVNYSCDSVPDALILKQKLQLLNYNIPLVVTVPEDYVENDPTIKVCPAQKTDVECVKCQWCAMPDRSWIIAFKMHGSRRKQWSLTKPTIRV